jgi:hypothetical protein
MKQIHDRVVFEPISIKEMTKLEKKRAMESLIFLTELISIEEMTKLERKRAMESLIFLTKRERKMPGHECARMEAHNEHTFQEKKHRARPQLRKQSLLQE